MQQWKMLITFKTKLVKKELLDTILCSAVLFMSKFIFNNFIASAAYKRHPRFIKVSNLS